MGSAPGHACFWHPVSSGSRAKDEGGNGGTGGRRFSASGTVIQSEHLQRMSAGAAVSHFAGFSIFAGWADFKCTTPSDGQESFSIFIEWIVLDQHWCDTVFSVCYQWNCSSFDSSLGLILLGFATKYVFVHNLFRFVFFSLMFCILGTLWFYPQVSLE